MSDSLRPHELQHARPPCLSPTPGVHPNSCPSSQWCHPDISSSVVPFSSCPQSLPASGSFPMSQLFACGGQSIGVSASASVLPTRQHIKKQRHYFANKGPCSQSYGFSSSHVWMWKLHHKKSWAPKNWWFWTMVLEKTLESPLDSKEIKLVNPKRNQSWIFIGRTDAEVPILWPPDAKEVPNAGKDSEQEADYRGWDCWMASLTQWTWVWASSRWRTGKPGTL